jgi:hypothetical protein
MYHQQIISYIEYNQLLIQKIDKNVKVGFIAGFSVYYESLKEVFPIDEGISFFKKPIEIGTLVERIQTEMLK